MMKRFLLILIDILIDLTNLGTPKSDYGQAIEAVVTNFTNYFSSKDNTLEPNPEKPIYPFFETDLALGQSGYQKVPYDSKLQNHSQIITSRMMSKMN